MLIAFEAVLGCTVNDADGVIGSLHDLLFDRDTWHIRYLVVSTEEWVRHKHILLSPEVVRRAAWSEDQLDLDVDRRQIEKYPDVGEVPALTREKEIELAGHFGWQPYWESIVPVIKEEPPRLWRARELVGYGVFTGKSDVGEVEDLIVDDRAWQVRQFLIDVGSWIEGRRVLVATEHVKAIEWDRRQLRLDLSKARLQQQPPYDPAALVGPEEQDQLHDLYEQ